MPGIVPDEWTALQFYTQATQALNIAAQHNIPGWEDKFDLICAACTSRGGIWRSDSLPALLDTHTWPSGELGPWLSRQPALLSVFKDKA